MCLVRENFFSSQCLRKLPSIILLLCPSLRVSSCEIISNLHLSVLPCGHLFTIPHFFIMALPGKRDSVLHALLPSAIHRLYGTTSLHGLSACLWLPGPIYAFKLVLSTLCQSAYSFFPHRHLAGLLLLASVGLVIIFLFASSIRTCPERVGNIIFRCKFNASRLHASTG